MLYATYAALGGTILGIYVVFLLITLINTPASLVNQVLPIQLPSLTTGLAVSNLSPVALLVIFVVSAATVGTLSGTITYYQRWYTPKKMAEARGLQIDESLPRTVAFMFALSRSGMSYRKVMDILVQNAQYFGGAAREFTVSRRDIKLSNSDLLTATERLARTSPSDEFASFAEDLSNVLRTGQSIPEYLLDKYNEYQEDKKTKQEQILEEISALAEGYVALLVAGPLFLITLLVVIGLLLGGTLLIVRIFIYIVIPLANIGFLVFLSRFSKNLGADSTVVEFEANSGVETQGDKSEPSADADRSEPNGSVPASDGGTTLLTDQMNLERLHAYERMRGVRQVIKSPVKTAVRHPTKVLFPVCAVAFIYMLVRVYAEWTAGQLSVRTVDDILIQSTILIFGVFAIAQKLNSDRIDRIEEGVPDLIERLANSTGAGMTLTTALERVDSASIPELETEINRIQRDLKVGTKASKVLKTFAQRAKSLLLVRAVILITNANRASNNISPVLRIAADEALLDRRLKRRRRQDLFIYRIIIYMSFVIFLGIVGALILLFIPSLPSQISIPSVGGGAAPGSAPGGGLSGIGLGGLTGANRDAYTLALFHSAVVQAIFAGLVAGKLSEGTIRAGVKHGTIMLIIAYIMMILIG